MGSRSCQGDVQAATQILQSNWWWTHSEAGIFRTQSSQDNQEIIEVIYWTKMEEKICFKLYCFYSTSSPFGLCHIEDSKSAKDMLMFKDTYIYIYDAGFVLSS